MQRSPSPHAPSEMYHVRADTLDELAKVRECSSRVEDLWPR